jgi:Fungal protein kinase
MVLLEYTTEGRVHSRQIGVLRGEQNSFMYDLESFFWVLFWICLHRESSSIKTRIIPQFEEWWYLDLGALVQRKLEVIRNEDYFLRISEEHCGAYHNPMIPWVNRLRKVVFPDDALTG